MTIAKKPSPPAEPAADAPPVLLDAEEADDWADTLRHAGSLIFHLAGDPNAEQLNERLSDGTAPAIADLGADLLGMADQLTDTTTADRNPRKIHGNEDTQQVT